MPPFGDFGVTYSVHLWLIGKCTVYFVLVLIELSLQLSRLRRYKQILVKVVVFKRGVVHLQCKFEGKGGHPPMRLGGRKLESLDVLCHPLGTLE